MMASRLKDASGNALLTILVLTALAAALSAMVLDYIGASANTLAGTKRRDSDNYNNESAIHANIAWLRANGENLAHMFSRDNFYTNFDVVDPAYGSNEGSYIKSFSTVRLQGTTNTPILSSSPTLAISNFPNSINAGTGAAFATNTAYANLVLSDSRARISLIDYGAMLPLQNFGDPDNGAAQPQTDFYPILKIDAISESSSGAQLTGFVRGIMLYDNGPGFYANTDLTIGASVTCDSYISRNGTYGGLNRPNCSTFAGGNLSMASGAKTYGYAKAGGTITANETQVCGTMTVNCPSPGDQIGGASSLPVIPTLVDWGDYCPSPLGDLTIATDSTLTIDDASKNCWDNVTINSGATLTLTTSDFAYYFSNLWIKTGGAINFAPQTADNLITLNINTLDSTNIDGALFVTNNNRPHQVVINYHSNNAIAVVGSTPIHMMLFAPIANVNVVGTGLVFAGGITAENLSISGTTLHQDESAFPTTLRKMAFWLQMITPGYLS